LTKKKLIEHFNNFYTKKNMLFIISTGIDRQVVMKNFDNLTKHVKKNEKHKFVIKKQLCFQNKQRIVYVKEPTAKNTDIEIYFPLDIYINNEDYPYLNIVSSIVAGDLTSLLLSVLRGKLKLVYGVKCYTNTNMCGTVVNIIVSTLDNNVNRVVEKIFEICKIYSKKLITTNKLLQAKRKFKMQIYQKNLNSVKFVRNFYAIQYLYQLNDKNKKIYTLKEKIKKINGLTKGKVRSIIKKIFDTKNCLIVYQGKKNILKTKF